MNIPVTVRAIEVKGGPKKRPWKYSIYIGRAHHGLVSRNSYASREGALRAGQRDVDRMSKALTL